MTQNLTAGKIILEEGKYFLDHPGGREELPPELLAAEASLKKLAGTQVEVLLSEPRRVVVGIKPPRRPPIICYLPVPWFHELHPEAKVFKKPRPICYYPVDWIVKGVEDKVRLNLANELLEQGIIGKEVHAKLVGH